jgi:hypothetical protein
MPLPSLSVPLPNSAAHTFPSQGIASQFPRLSTVRITLARHICSFPLPLGSRPFKSLPVHRISHIANPLQSYAVPAQLTAFNSHAFRGNSFAVPSESIPSYSIAYPRHSIPQRFKQNWAVPFLCNPLVSLSLANISSLCCAYSAQFYSLASLCYLCRCSVCNLGPGECTLS